MNQDNFKDIQNSFKQVKKKNQWAQVKLGRLQNELD